MQLKMFCDSWNCWAVNVRLFSMSSLGWVDLAQLSAMSSVMPALQLRIFLDLRHSFERLCSNIISTVDWNTDVKCIWWLLGLPGFSSAWAEYCLDIPHLPWSAKPGLTYGLLKVLWMIERLSTCSSDVCIVPRLTFPLSLRWYFPVDPWGWWYFCSIVTADV